MDYFIDRERLRTGCVWMLSKSYKVHTDFPLIHSVANDDDAIADPHPKVLNFASIIFPLSSTSICSFITSPQAGAPTRPVPTFFFLASNFPTFLGFS